MTGTELWLAHTDVRDVVVTVPPWSPLTLADHTLQTLEDLYGPAAREWTVTRLDPINDAARRRSGDHSGQ